MSLLEYLRATGSKKFRVVGQYADGGVAQPTPNPLPPKEWVRNWYANRQIPNANLSQQTLLNNLRPKAIEAIDSLPSYDIRDKGFMGSALAHYRPEDHAISVLDSFYNNPMNIQNGKLNSNLVHEMAHAVDVYKGNSLFEGINKDVYGNNVNKNDILSFLGDDIQKETEDTYKSSLNDFLDFYKLKGKSVEDFKKATGYNKDGMIDENIEMDILEALNDTNLYGFIKTDDFEDEDKPLYQILYDMANGKYKRASNDEATMANINQYQFDKLDYLSNDSEVNSRIMQLRYDMGVKPDEEVSESKLLDFINKKGVNNLDYLQELFKVIPSKEKGILDILNKTVNVQDKKKGVNSGYLDYLKMTRNT